jgi:hypothetical protein
MKEIPKAFTDAMQPGCLIPPGASRTVRRPHGRPLSKEDVMPAHSSLMTLTLAGTLMIGAAVQTVESVAAAACGDEVCAELQHSRLNLQKPVFVQGPIPSLLRSARVGDLIQLQVSYPISPPFPTKACVETDNRALSAECVVGTPGEVAILTLKPQSGRIGVGFISAFVRAHTAGKATATVTVVFPDGTKKAVPFAFQIEGEPGAEDPPAAGCCVPCRPRRSWCILRRH